MDQNLVRGFKGFGAPLSWADWRGYAVGVLSVAAAVVLRWIFAPLLGEHQPYVTFFAAIAVTAMYGSLGGSILALLLSMAAAVFLFLPPLHSLQAEELQAEVGLVTYAFSAGLIIFSGELLRHARRRTSEEYAARTEAEAALRQNEEQFRASFELAAVGKAQADPRTGRFWRVNPMLCEMTGYSAEELLQKSNRDITHPEDLDADIRLFQETIDGKRPFYQNEKRYVRKDGSIVWVQATATLQRDAQGRPIRSLSVIQDVTARRQAEQALAEAKEELRRYADELEERVAERTRSLQNAVGELEAFSYSVSHDMRAPLRAMHQFSQMLAEDYGSKLDDTGRDYLQRIRNSARRLDKLIQDVLTYSRVGRINSPPERVDLEKLVRQLIGEYPALQAPAALVEIQSPLLPVLGQEASLTQCLSNVLGNAVKFVARGVVPHVRVRTESRHGQVRLWVEDNGIGIAPRNHERIFDMFERIHSPKEYEGTGIGLAIVRKAVERMGGQIGLESDIGKGSRFWIELPHA